MGRRHHECLITLIVQVQCTSSLYKYLMEIVIKHETAHLYNFPFSSFSRLLGAPACLLGSLTNAHLPSPSFNFLTFSLDIPAPHIPMPWHTCTKHHNYLTINLLWKFAFDFVRKHCNQVPESPGRWAGLSAEMHCRIKRFSKRRSRQQAGLARRQGGWVERPVPLWGSGHYKCSTRYSGSMDPKMLPWAHCDKHVQVLRPLFTYTVICPGPAPAETRGKSGLKYTSNIHL